MLQPLVPRQLLRLLEELLVLRRHGRLPPPPPRGRLRRTSGTIASRVLQRPPRVSNSGGGAFVGRLDRRGWRERERERERARGEGERGEIKRQTKYFPEVRNGNEIME
jgi:hypothetical protein